MNLRYRCSACGAQQRAKLAAEPSVLHCAGCAQEIRLRNGAVEGRTLRECAVCGTTDLYFQKDFPHRTGLVIVVIGFILSSVAWADYHYPLSIGILMATAAIDLCLFYVVGNVLVCYRCLGEYRGFDRRPDQQAFDLAIGERYRQERIRLESLRSAPRSSVESRE